MGAEASLLQECELEEPLASSLSQDGWVVYPATRCDGTRVTLFVHDRSPGEDLSQYRSAGNHLKLLRHPSILKFYGSVETSSALYLMTEEVLPLGDVLENQSPEEVCAGIYNIIEALVFLHEKGNMCHNNICASSIFVCPDGSWKLGGTEFLCPAKKVTLNYLEQSRSSRDPNAITPEEKSGHLVLTPEVSHSRDVFAFGTFCEQLMEYMAPLDDQMKTFELRIQDECLHNDPKQRPHLSTLMDDRLFRNDYVQIVNFLKNVTLKSDEEKKIFFSSVAKKLAGMPKELVARRLVRPFLARFVLLDQTAVNCLIPHLLSPSSGDAGNSTFVDGEINPLLPENLYRKYVIPELFKIFHVRDVHVRLVLMTYFQQYVHMFDKRTLEVFILPQILIGLRDTNDQLVEASLHATAELVPLLGGDVVVGQNRLKVFSEGKPKASGGAEQEVRKVRTVSGAINLKSTSKVLNSKISTSNSPEKKPTLQELARQAERDKKRAEARKRSEERRKKREEQRQSPKRDVYIEDIPEEDGSGTLANGPHHVTKNMNSVRLSDDHENTDNGVTSHAQSKVLHHYDDDEENESVTSDVIEDEIENELSAMDSTLSDSEKVRVESSPVHSHTQSKHNPTPRTPPKKGSGMKLSVKKTRTSPPPDLSGSSARSSTSPQRQSVENWGNDNWDNDWSQETTEEANGWSDEWDKTLQKPVPSQWDQTGHDAGEPKPLKSKPLGAEFDIMALDIKTSQATPPEFDFFADMQPELKSLSQDWTVEEDKALTSESKSDQKSSKFAAADVDTASAGWGQDDMDWGDTEDWA